MAKILLIEDNEMNRDMLCRLLRVSGFEVAVAADGEEGLNSANAERPDVIVMDLGLPGMDGWEATRRLKAAPATRDIPVLAFTANVMSTDRQRAEEAGVDAFETKPVNLPRLLRVLEDLMKKKPT